jgi:sodium-independent sulfate anion transporter 11
MKSHKTIYVSVVGNEDDTGSRRQDLVNWMHEKARKSFTKKVLYKRVPVLCWLPKYNSQDAIGDLVAGITVGLTVIPQSLAYANVAGLPTEVCIINSVQFLTVSILITAYSGLF